MTTLVATRPRTQPRNISVEIAFIRDHCKPLTETQIESDEAEYQTWKRANDLDKPLSRSEYDDLFHIYF